MNIAEIRLEIVEQLLGNYPNMPTDALIDKADKISDFIANGKTDVLSDDESYKLERALAMVVQKVDIPTAMHQAKVIANFLKTGKTIGIEAFENATKVPL